MDLLQSEMGHQSSQSFGGPAIAALSLSAHRGEQLRSIETSGKPLTHGLSARALVLPTSRLAA